ncbi:MAG: PepSY-like domain-containing protein [Muribaculaceae bacterium]|nr:PepSY-like domain-containing protein [Muribaculaceae bacterium]
MKKFSFNAFSISAILFMFCSCSGNNDAAQQQVAVPVAQEQPVQAAPVDTMVQTQAQAAAPQTALPEAITAFIKQHFPNATIVGIEPDNEHGGPEYDVYLNDGTQIDFDVNDQWEKVESMKGVPAFFIPQAIATYVKSNYQNMTITKVNKEHHGYEIELANGLDLNFDNSGRFLGMDD